MVSTGITLKKIGYYLLLISALGLGVYFLYRHASWTDIASGAAMLLLVILVWWKGRDLIEEELDFASVFWFYREYMKVNFGKTITNTFEPVKMDKANGVYKITGIDEISDTGRITYHNFEVNNRGDIISQEEVTNMASVLAFWVKGYNRPDQAILQMTEELTDRVENIINKRIEEISRGKKEDDAR